MCFTVYVLPEIANPLKPTAKTKNEIATPLVWEYPTTKSKVASIPKPAKEMYGEGY